MTPRFALLWHFAVPAGAVRGSVSSEWGLGSLVHPVAQQKLLQEGFLPRLLSRLKAVDRLNGTAVLVAFADIQNLPFLMAQIIFVAAQEMRSLFP